MLCSKTAMHCTITARARQRTRRQIKGIGTMDKKVYEIPELERITLVEEDIITASPGAEHTGDPDCLIDFP